MGYRVPPGLYAHGTPNGDSPVLVTANYKLTFDAVRSQLAGRDAWLLVLDTKGVNVWCAAAKGTFGTDELVRRVKLTNLAAVVSHDLLIVPQLGAVGVTARDVRKGSGFRVIFGPVYAADLTRFLDAGFKAPDMHTVRFSFRERMVLIPVELSQVATKLLAVAVCLVLLAGVGADGFSLDRVLGRGIASAGLFLLVTVAAAVLGPALLPWLPGRAFSVKGLSLGLLFTITLVVAWTASGTTWLRGVDVAAWCLAIPATTSFLLMAFTGATPYTSLSGVRREIRTALPWQIVAAVVGIMVWVLGCFV